MNVWQNAQQLCGARIHIFDNDTCKDIIARLRLKSYDDPKTQAFVNQVLALFDEKLSYAPYIELDGNL